MVIWEKRWSAAHGVFELGRMGDEGEQAEMIRINNFGKITWCLRVYGAKSERLGEEPRRIVTGFKTKGEARDHANATLLPEG